MFARTFRSIKMRNPRSGIPQPKPIASNNSTLTTSPPAAHPQSPRSIATAKALHMALAMSHHNAYTAVGRDTGTLHNHNHNHYPGDGGEPGPAPTVLELMEPVVEGRIDSDPQVACRMKSLMCCFSEIVCWVWFRLIHVRRRWLCYGLSALTTP